MAMDVDEAYRYLMACGTVYTVRPSWNDHPVDKSNVHLHRKSKYTGDIAQKTLVARGAGEKVLVELMGMWVKDSGFKTVEEWIDKLIAMHGKAVTTKSFTIYKVELLFSLHNLKQDLEMVYPGPLEWVSPSGPAPDTPHA